MIKKLCVLLLLLLAGCMGIPRGVTVVDNFAIDRFLGTWYEVARIDESREGAVIQVLDAAQPPESKSSPKKAQIAVNTTLTVGFGLLLLIFVRKALRSVGKRPETAQR